MKIEYNNLYIHYVFTTYRREPVIEEKNRERIEKYITGIVNNNKSKIYAIYANPEHIHFLISKHPSISDEYIASVVANGSEKFINENKLTKNNFAWQQSASAFSVSKSDIKRVCTYIENQPKHHKKSTFKDEYDAFLKHYQDTIHKFDKNNNKK